jgi:hypothetical protein
MHAEIVFCNHRPKQLRDKSLMTTFKGVHYESKIDLRSRRAFLLGAGSAVLLMACGKLVPAGPQRSLLPLGDPAFMHLSQVLTGKMDLDPVTAARMADAFGKLYPKMSAQFAGLAKLAAHATNPASLIEASGEAKPTALAIIASWYTGTVGSGTQAVTLAYRDALMQRPVADALWPPTYARGGPGWWTATPPDVASRHA